MAPTPNRNLERHTLCVAPVSHDMEGPARFPRMIAKAKATVLHASRALPLEVPVRSRVRVSMHEVLCNEIEPFTRI